MRFAIVVMDIFDILRQSLQKQLRIVFNENHVAGIGQPPADGKNRLCRTPRCWQAAISVQRLVSHPVKLGVDTFQNRKEGHLLGFVEFIERTFCDTDSLCQLIH